MSRLVLLTGLLAASVAAQANHAAPGFKYIGCVEAEAPQFPWKATLPASFSAEECQHACHEKGKYAALDSDGCHCHDASSEPQFKVLEESVCRVPCVEGDEKAGVCGGPECTVTGKKRFTLYEKEEEDDACEQEHGDKDPQGQWDNNQQWHGDKDQHDHEDKDQHEHEDKDPQWQGDNNKEWHGDKDQQSQEDKNKDIGVWNKEAPAKTTTEIKTITSCPPEVTDCPLTAHTKAVDPPLSPITKHHDASSAEPWAHPSPQPTKPECDGEHCKEEWKAPAPTCPPGGCVKLITDEVPSHARPTGGLVPTKVPVTISGGVKYQAGVVMVVTALVMAVSLL